MDTMLLLIVATMNAGTPLALAALGLLLNERSGVVNLGAEGMMLAAAMVGFAAAVTTGSPWWGLAAGAIAGMVLAAGFAFLVVVMGANQHASGLALMLFGTGVSAFGGVSYAGRALEGGRADSSWLSGIPVLGETLASPHPMVYLTLLLAAVLAWFIYRTRPGLVLRAVGESPESAYALGHPVRMVRALAILGGGACCGLAGAYLSVVYTQLWVEGMVAGRGWMALAMIAFGAWHPGWILLGAYLFGGLTILQFQLQGTGIALAPQFIAMLPYICTVAVLAMRARGAGATLRRMPASLGKPFLLDR